MKRAGNLFDSVLDMENLRLAFWKASRGKRAREDQREYAANLDVELARLRAGLADGTYPVGAYRRFTVYEPKERIVCAAAFRERVLHHAFMNVLEPWIEKWLVFDTYACRKGKGQLAAVDRALGFARKYRYFLKCDIRKFFDSVPHAGIEAMLRRKIKDESVIWWLMRIVGTHETEPGRGVPIGNLTSQHLANLYLDPLDRFRGGGYVRYMDDFVYWADDKELLCRVRDAVGGFLVRVLGLQLKESPYINRTAHGMDFLGFRVRPDGLRAAREGLKRYKRKMRMCGMLFREGMLSENAYQDRITALTAPLLAARTRGWRCAHFGDPARSVGCEPRETGRELEQRGGQLPAGVSQQQHADEPQQQQRLPRPLLRSVAI
jgi:retron-type reverse transcriptase